MLPCYPTRPSPTSGDGVGDYIQFMRTLLLFACTLATGAAPRSEPAERPRATIPEIGDTDDVERPRRHASDDEWLRALDSLNGTARPAVFTP